MESTIIYADRVMEDLPVSITYLETLRQQLNLLTCHDSVLKGMASTCKAGAYATKLLAGAGYTRSERSLSAELYTASNTISVAE